VDGDSAPRERKGGFARCRGRRKKKKKRKFRPLRSQGRVGGEKRTTVCRSQKGEHSLQGRKKKKGGGILSLSILELGTGPDKKRNRALSPYFGGGRGGKNRNAVYPDRASSEEAEISCASVGIRKSSREKEMVKLAAADSILGK